VHVELPASVPPVVEELQRLHRAVGTAIGAHHFGYMSLPTKDGKLDWGLGPEVRAIREAAAAVPEADPRRPRQKLRLEGAKM
jgi:hypothetical protein